MKKSTRTWLWAIVIILIVIGAAKWAGDEGQNGVAGRNRTDRDDIIRIGVVLPLTGKYASISEDALGGLMLAQEDFGSNIEFSIEDSAGESQKSVSAITHLIHNKKSELILAGPGSTANIAMAQVANTLHIPFLAITSTPELMKKDDFVFTILPSITGEAKKMSEVAIAKNLKTAAVIFDSASDTLKTASGIFAKNYEAKGGTVTFSEGYGQDNIDYKTLAAKAIATKPDIVYLLAQDKIAVPLLKQVRDLGYEGLVAGFSAAGSDEFLRNTKHISEGFLITSIPFSCNSSEYNNAYCTKYRAKYNREPIFYGAYMYDTARWILEAKKNCANNAVGTDLRSCILKQTPIQRTLTDSFRFDQFGDLPDDLPILMKEVKDGTFVEAR